MRGATTTRGDKANTESVIGLLNDALATEVICILRYKRHCYMTAGIGDRQVKAKFLQLVTEEGEHADHLVERIVQLGSKPDLSLERLLLRCQSDHVEGDSLGEMMTAYLVAERMAVESYCDMLAASGPDDPTIQHVLERILAKEEARASLSGVWNQTVARFAEDEGAGGHHLQR